MFARPEGIREPDELRGTGGEIQGLSSPVLSKDKVNRTAAMVEGIEDVTDISELVRYCHA